jgi:photosystem II stability/assembly factor-like uncharacterized protein
MLHRLFLLYLVLCSGLSAAAQPIESPEKYFNNTLRWRCIGPHRGGRTVGAVGVPQQPGLFYIGVNNGGVWRTDDYGRTWSPIFDDQPTGSIGDIVVAPSDPNIIYVGTGEGLHRPDLSTGDGVYKSKDAGRTWQHMGLKDAQQIGGLAIDPINPDRVFAAVLGHPYGPNQMRGVYRTTNGGHLWEKLKVKNLDSNTGAIQVVIDPANAQVIYAVMWEARMMPWENGRATGPNSGLYKSTDGGDTWQHLTNGLPTTAEGLSRIGLCISPSDPKRLYATVECPESGPNAAKGGIYRSDDAGLTWYQLNNDQRLWGRGYDFAEIKADPLNPDVVYCANVVTWKSTDGGLTWQAWRGAPGGDDYHRIWIHPTQPNIILLASDQGAIITVNGGRTFSSWYNQPTAQFYHVITDNQFPYNVYSGQQESGSACVSSRGPDGQITFRDWYPVGVDEYGYVAPDPLDPNIIYGGKLARHDRRTGQTQNVMPVLTRGGNYRFLRTAPLLFSPKDPHQLYFAGNVLFKTTNGGQSWQTISPDLSRSNWEVPLSVGHFNVQIKDDVRQRGVIYALALAHQDTNVIWAGTDDGLIHRTTDGGRTWQNITPPRLPAWSKISQLDAGHFNVQTCYVAVNSIRLDDQRAHVLRTHDGGRTWTDISANLPDEPVNVVREDPQVPGLLYAGTERAVYVSFDDGKSWHSLRQNMPATSIRDLVVKDDDLVVGTHGRSFWILDQIKPLRTIADGRYRMTGLLPLPDAWRVRWNLNTDTPLPQEEPAGQNPPDGAIIDYFLARDARNLTLEITDSTGIIRRITPEDVAPDVSQVNIPLYWVRPHPMLSKKAGAHRFYWDMRLDPLPGVPTQFPIAAVYGQTAPNPTAPLALPGTYTVRLTVDDTVVYEQPLTLKLDPRISTTPAQLRQLHTLSADCLGSYYFLERIQKGYTGLSKVLDMAIPLADSTRRDSLQRKLSDLKGFHNEASALQGNAMRLFEVLDETDHPATQTMVQSAQSLNETANQLSARYNKWSMAHDNMFSDLRKFAKVPKRPYQPSLSEHPAADASGFEPLLKADLSNAIYPAGIWSVTDGELTATEDQCIWTKERYTNFVLDLEFKCAEGTNSGVIFHCSNTDNWIPNSVEVQIADDFATQWSTADPTWRCGAVFGHLAARRSAVKRPGEWNRYTIISIDRQIWVLLNDQLVNHMDMSRWLSGSTNPDGSAIPSWLPKPFATLPLEGHIGFQGKHAGAPVWFRNMRVRRL